MLNVASKLMSIVLTIRLQIDLEKGTPIQFGAFPNIICSDGSFSLRSILQTNKEHEIEGSNL